MKESKKQTDKTSLNKENAKQKNKKVKTASNENLLKKESVQTKKSKSKLKENSGKRKKISTKKKNTVIVKKEGLAVEKQISDTKKKKKTTKTKENKKEVVQLTEKLDALNADYEVLKSNYDTLVQQQNKLQETLQVTKNMLSESNTKNINLQKEIDKRNAVLRVYNANAQTNQEDALKKIASKLKVEYIDFQSAANMQMSVELGENLRAQLETVFKILNKCGIIIGD